MKVLEQQPQPVTMSTAELIDVTVQQFAVVIPAKDYSEIVAPFKGLAPTALEDETVLADVKAAKKTLSVDRIAIERLRKELKEDSLKLGKAIDAKAKELAEPITGPEATVTALLNGWEAHKAEKERLEKEAVDKMVSERVNALAKYGREITRENALQMDVEAFTALLNWSISEWEIEQAMKEAERVAAENARIEAEKKAAELAAREAELAAKEAALNARIAAMEAAELAAKKKEADALAAAEKAAQIEHVVNQMGAMIEGETADIDAALPNADFVKTDIAFMSPYSRNNINYPVTDEILRPNLEANDIQDQSAFESVAQVDYFREAGVVNHYRIGDVASSFVSDTAGARLLDTKVFILEANLCTIDGCSIPAFLEEINAVIQKYRI